MLEKLRKILDILILILSVYMLYNGIRIFIGTSGQVVGSEFGLLILLANQLSLIILWLGLFSIRKLIKTT